ncbi:MAG: divergent polysaccharide deacetylase family protein [Pseudomonadota bacterium]
MKRELLKGLTGIVLLVVVIATVAMIADFFLNRHPSSPALTGKTAVHDRQAGSVTEVKKPAVVKSRQDKSEEKQPAAVTKVFEVFDDGPAREPLHREPAPRVDDSLPRVAIIIDDIGFDKTMAHDMAALDGGITLSILPGAPFGGSIARSLKANGTEIMLHLPMEPMEYPGVDPGRGAVLMSMTPDEVIDQVRKDLDEIPGVSGVNNHMGSRITTLSSTMYQIFTVLKQRDLFFIDSRTSRDSLCRPSSRLLQVPFAQRDVFLDNIQDPAYIKNQIRELIDIARRHGTAIGIGHPYKATYMTLKDEIETLKGKVKLVPASSLVSPAG